MADTSYTPNESAELPFSLEAEQTIQPEVRHQEFRQL